MIFIRTLIIFSLSVTTISQANAVQVVAENYSVKGSACLGQDCNNGESFGNDTVRLKENNTRIRLWDTDIADDFVKGGFELQANDSANGGRNHFSFGQTDTEQQLSNGFTNGYDAAGNFHMPLPEGSPVFAQDGSPILVFIIAPSVFLTRDHVSIGHSSIAKEDALSIGHPTLLRQLKFVAAGLVETDILITGQINSYDPLSVQKQTLDAAALTLADIEAKLNEIDKYLDVQSGLDNDADGSPDFTDADDDNDGIPDNQENGDFNRDGIPDNQQKEGSVDGLGAGSLSFLNLLLLALLSLKRSFFKVILLCTPLITFSANAAANCGSDSHWSDIDCFYIGAGIAQSTLSSDTNDTAWEDDNQSQAFSVYAGRDLGDRLRTEAGYSKLGESTFNHRNPFISDEESIEYQAGYANAQYSFWKPSYQWDVYAGLGASWVKTQASKGLNSQDESSLRALTTLGAGWHITPKFHLQARSQYFAGAGFSNGLALNYYFGKANQRSTQKNLPSMRDINEQLSSEPSASGTANSSIESYSSLACTPSFENTVMAFTYQAGQTTLSPSQVATLTTWLANGSLLENSSIVIAGHSDQQGTALNNLKVSAIRAEKAALLLIAQGADEKQIQIQAMGEFDPLSQNPDDNRRIEIEVNQTIACP